MKKEYSVLHFVQYYETDQMKVVHHANYVRWMEEARVAFLEKIGWSYARMEENGLISPVTKVCCDYRKSTTFDDLVDIYVEVNKVSHVKADLSYVMKNAVTGEVVAKGTSCHGFIKKEGKPIVIDREMPEFYEAMKSYESEGTDQ